MREPLFEPWENQGFPNATFPFRFKIFSQPQLNMDFTNPWMREPNSRPHSEIDKNNLPSVKSLGFEVNKKPRSKIYLCFWINKYIFWMREPRFELGLSRVCFSLLKEVDCQGTLVLPHWQRDVLPLNYSRILFIN